MGDMSSVIIPKSDQINYEDLITGPITITITGVVVKPGADQPVSVSFEGSGKVYRPCKSMSKVMVKVWGPDSKAFVGHSMTLYGDPKVKWGGMEVGGIRISHMTGLSSPMALALAETKTKRIIHQVQPLKVAKPEPPKTQEPAPTIETAKTKGQFIAALTAALRDAPDRAAVDAILSMDRVGAGMTFLSADDRSAMDKNVTAALSRTAPPPTDTTNDGWTTEADGVLP
jgi:hypothetical protein